MPPRSFVLRLAFGTTLACYAAASFTHDARLWGVNALSFYPVSIRVFAFALVFLAFVPRVRDTVLHCALVGTRSHAELGELRERRGLAAILFAAIAFALFLAAPARTLLWGDGNYVAGFVRDAARANSAGFATYLKHPHPGIAGTDFVFTVLGRFVSHVFHVDSVAAIRGLAALCGAFLVFMLTRWLLRAKPAAAPIDRLFAALAVTSGASMLFFGYVEVYAPFLTIAILYVATSWRALRGGSVWKPVACALIATLLHLMGLLLLPSLAFLILWVARGRRESPRLFMAARACAIALLPLPWILREVPRLRALVVPLAGGNGALLAPMHAVDVTNELLLVVPTVAVIGMATLVTVLGRRSRHVEAVRGAGAPWETAFTCLLVVPAFLFLVAFRSDIGMARDWDLFAPAAAAALFLFWFVLRRTPPAAALLATGGFAFPLVVLSATVTAAWVGVNHSPARSVARYQTVMTRGAIDTGYAYETLALYHKDRGDARGEISALESAVSVSTNPRYRSWLALRYFSAGEKEKALVEMRRYLRSRPEDVAARQYFVHMLHYTNHPDELLSVCAEGARLHPTDPFYPFYGGKTLATLGRRDEAVSALRRAGELNPPREMAAEIEKTLASINAAR